LIRGSLDFELAVYSGYQSFVWCVAGKYFLLLCVWSVLFWKHFFFLLCRIFLISGSLIYLFFLFSCWVPGVLLKKYFPIPITSRVFPALFCTNFRVLCLILKSLIYLEMILVQGDKNGSSFSFLQADNHFSQQHLLKRLLILHHMFLVPLSKIRCA
jgi:hypothetical protein